MDKDIEEFMKDLGDKNVMEAVMERHAKIVSLIEQLDIDLSPAEGEEFKLKDVLDNLRQVHKASDEMIMIFMATAIQLGGENE